MTKRDLEYYLNMHKLMWLDIAKHIAQNHATIDIYHYKISWCSRRNLAPYNKCFACQFAIQLKWVENIKDDEMYFSNMCTYCPLRWPGSGDENYQFFCEYNYNFDNHGNLGLWMLAYRQHDLELDAMIKRKPLTDKFWKKQCKLCYKIAMLPVDEDIIKLVTESL